MCIKKAWWPLLLDWPNLLVLRRKRRRRRAPDNFSGSSNEDDVVMADKPPEIPAPGETDDGPPSLGNMSFLDADAADRSGAIYFGGSVMGSPSRLQSWAPGAEPILVSPSAELAAQSVDLEYQTIGARGQRQ